MRAAMIRPVQKIRPMTREERQRAKEKEKANTGKCVSCGAPTHNEWCDFCLREE
jgi:recombinational DNA repair protein RecR